MKNENRDFYPSDLSDAEWEIIEPLIPPAKPGGRPRKVDMREILNGIFYLSAVGLSARAFSGVLPYPTIVLSSGLFIATYCPSYLSEKIEYKTHSVQCDSGNSYSNLIN